MSQPEYDRTVDALIESDIETQVAIVPALQTALTKVAASTADAAMLSAAFAPHFADLQGLIEEARGVAQDQPKKAKALRLAIRAVRCASEATRKRVKDESLRRGKAIDGIHNVLEFQSVPVEEALDAIEKAEEIKESQRLAALAASRAEQLRPYLDPTHMSLAEMDENAFTLLLGGAKAAAQAKADADAAALARDAAELEAKRIRDEEQRVENERLRVAAAEAEKKLTAERAVRAAELAKAEETARAERQVAAAKLEAETRKAQIAQAEALRLQAAEFERAKREADAKAEKDRLAKLQATEIADRERAKASAPDAAKVLALAQTLRELHVPVLSTTDGKLLQQRILSQCEKFAAWLEAEAKKL